MSQTNRSNESSGKPIPEAQQLAPMQPLQIDGVNIDDLIAMHLIDCDQCREGAARGRPVKLGEKSPHCDTYWDLQLRRAMYEGEVNNIVGYTEYGDEAPRRGQLE